jgi:hypothetical protein
MTSYGLKPAPEFTVYMTTVIGTERIKPSTRRRWRLLDKREKFRDDMFSLTLVLMFAGLFLWALYKGAGLPV